MEGQRIGIPDGGEMKMGTDSLAVDRIEGETAVLVDGKREVAVPIHWLPPGVVEGSVVRLVVDQDGTRDLRDRVDSALHKLSERDGGETEIEL